MIPSVMTVCIWFDHLMLFCWWSKINVSIFHWFPILCGILKLHSVIIWKRCISPHSEVAASVKRMDHFKSIFGHINEQHQLCDLSLSQLVLLVNNVQKHLMQAVNLKHFYIRFFLTLQVGSLYSWILYPLMWLNPGTLDPDWARLFPMQVLWR